MIRRALGLALILVGAGLGVLMLGVPDRRWNRGHDHCIRTGWLLVILGVFLSETAP